MILILAKAAGCSWTTARELSLMRAAGRKLTPDDLASAFERYKMLSRRPRGISSSSTGSAWSCASVKLAQVDKVRAAKPGAKAAKRNSRWRTRRRRAEGATSRI